MQGDVLLRTCSAQNMFCSEQKQGGKCRLRFHWTYCYTWILFFREHVLLGTCSARNMFSIFVWWTYKDFVIENSCCKLFWRNKDCLLICSTCCRLSHGIVCCSMMSAATVVMLCNVDGGWLLVVVCSEANRKMEEAKSRQGEHENRAPSSGVGEIEKGGGG